MLIRFLININKIDNSYNVFFRFMVVPGKNGANGETFSL